MFLERSKLLYEFYRYGIAPCVIGATHPFPMMSVFKNAVQLRIGKAKIIQPIRKFLFLSPAKNFDPQNVTVHGYNKSPAKIFCGKVITPGFSEKSPKLKGKTKDIMNLSFYIELRQFPFRAKTDLAY